jgi:hypothetical protein
MKPPNALSDLHRSFRIAVLCSFTCLLLLAAAAVRQLREISDGQRAHAATFVPAKRLTAGYEREVLNARIFFIYYVTIQKPGALASGWERFHNAETIVGKLAVMAREHSELAGLRGPVSQLQKDFASYTEALSATLAMVQGGELKGPHYDAMVKEWAARGAVMVKDAATVENLTFETGEANTKDIAHQLSKGQDDVLLLLAVSLVLCTLSLLVLRRRLKAALGALGAEAATYPASLGLHSPLGTGAH